MTMTIHKIIKTRYSSLLSQDYSCNQESKSKSLRVTIFATSLLVAYPIKKNVSGKVDMGNDCATRLSEATPERISVAAITT